MSANNCGCDPTHVPPHWCAEHTPDVTEWRVVVIVRAPTASLAEQVVGRYRTVIVREVTSLHATPD